MSAERPVGDQAPEREVTGERQTVSSFLRGMVEGQPRVVDGALGEISRELPASAEEVSKEQLKERLQRQLEGGMSDLGPEEAARFDQLIKGEEMKPESILWQENPDAPSMMGRVARSHREAVKEMLCEVIAADARSDQAA